MSRKQRKDLVIEGKTLEWTIKAKYLGITINEKLTNQTDKKIS